MPLDRGVLAGQIIDREVQTTVQAKERMSTFTGPPAPPDPLAALFSDPAVVKRLVIISTIIALGLLILSLGLPETLKYLLTDNKVTGWIAWVSLFVTVAGFAFSWWQLIRVAQATTAANIAIIATSGMVRGHEQIDRLNAALNYLRDADRQITVNNRDASMAYLDIGWSTLVTAKNLTKNQEDKDKLIEHLSDLVRMMEHMRRDEADSPTNTDDKTNRRSVINKILESLGEMNSKLRLSLSGLGV